MTATEKITISLPRDVLAFVARLAESSGRPRSQVIAQLLAEEKRRREAEALAEGYRRFAENNRRFAEEALPIAREALFADDRGAPSRP